MKIEELIEFCEDIKYGFSLATPSRDGKPTVSEKMYLMAKITQSALRDKQNGMVSVPRYPTQEVIDKCVNVLEGSDGQELSIRRYMDYAPQSELAKELEGLE